MTQNNLTKVAMVYDFDGTLSPGAMQEYDFIPSLGIKPLAFWEECTMQAKKHEADPILIYMNQMLKQASIKNVSVRRDDFYNYGKKVSFFKGVEDWFLLINEYAKQQGLFLEHYIISSGLKEMILGTNIAHNFKQIYASSFLYDNNNAAYWPAQAINYTTKTQFIFRINKGVLDASDHKNINEYTPDEMREIPFSRMIFIGDGFTDIPCMKLVKELGGHSIAVYDAKPNSQTGKKGDEVAERLISQNRVNFTAPADYSKGSRMFEIITAILNKLASEVMLADLKNETGE